MVKIIPIIYLLGDLDLDLLTLGERRRLGLAGEREGEREGDLPLLGERRGGVLLRGGDLLL